MPNRPLSINISQIEDIFPFYFALDEEMQIIKAGRSMLKLNKECIGKSFSDILISYRPFIEKLSFEQLLAFQKQVYVLKFINASQIILRGQFEYLPQHKCFMFVGSPWFYNIEELRASGLVLNDFAIQDPVIDLLHIIKTQELAADDITELLHTLKEQKKEMQKLSLVAEETHSAVIITDANGYVEWVNKAFTQISKFSLEDCKGKKPGLLLQGKDTDPETILYLRNQIADEKPFTCEILNYAKDGTPYWVYMVGQPNFNSKGKLTGFFAIEEDITAKRIAQNKLKYSEEKYRSIIENMELGLLEVDNDGLIVRSYPRFCELVGYEAEELLGKSALDLLVPKNHQGVLELQSQERKGGNAGTYEVPLIHKNGKWVWVLISGAPILNEMGEIVGSIGIHYNLTQRKILEEKLASAKKLAEDARHSEQKFLANMSHEIRTPLNAIIGMSHLLYDTRPTNEQKEYIDILNNSANFLHTLISNILDMAKIEAGRIEMNKKPFDLTGLVHTIQKTFQLKLDVRPIEVVAFIDSRISGSYIGDEMMLHQILMNLLSNAEKFTEEGQIEIVVKQTKKADDLVWIEFQVNDTGIGMASEDLAQIFDKFKQIQGAQGQKYKGTGLGLSIVKELIEIQGGIMSVTSEKGQGSNFKVTLPFVHSKEEVAQSPTITQSEAQYNFRGFLILIVEDNVMNRKYLTKLLEKKGISYDIAVDGLEAVRKVHDKKYDVILMDIQMPNMNGYEATLSIRNTHSHNQHTPIIALTASAMLDQKNKAFQVGMNDYISKPFTPIQLYEKLAIFFDHENQEEMPINSKDIIPFVEDLDREYLKELYDEDIEYALSMFQTFVTDVFPEFINKAKLLHTENTDEIAKWAHKIKPTAAMVGLTHLERQLKNLEENAHKGQPLATLRTSLSEIFDYFDSKKEIILTQVQILENLNS